MAEIKLTDTMAQALKNAHKDPTGTLLIKGVGRGTRKALESRGLAWVERNGRCPLTPEGEAVRLSMLSEEHNQDAGRMTLEEALSEAFPESVPGVKVTVLYADGTEEIVSNIPTDTIAVGIYTEATYNDRVRRAVLYRADGTEAQVYTNTVLVCGRQIDPRQIINETRYTGQLCSRERGHRGRHRVSTGSGTDQDNIHWDDDACLPLDHGH